MKQSAPLKKKFSALFYEYLTILCYMAILFGVTAFVCLVILGGIPAFDELGMNLISLTLIVPVAVAAIAMESGEKHATWGKRKMNLTVTSTQPGAVKLWQIVVRNIVKFLPWQLAHMAIFHAFALEWEFTPLWTVLMILVDTLPFLWIGSLFRKGHRGIHDCIAKTAVVENPIALE